MIIKGLHYTSNNRTTMVPEAISGFFFCFFTWALVSLRVTMWYRGPGVRSALPSLCALWIRCPVVGGAPWWVRVPRRPRIITISSLQEWNRTCEEWKTGGNNRSNARRREGAESSPVLYGVCLMRSWQLFQNNILFQTFDEDRASLRESAER